MTQTASAIYRFHRCHPLPGFPAEGTGVHVTVVCPGLTESEFHDVNGTRELVDRLSGLVWMDAATVAEQSLRAMDANQVSLVNGWINRGVATASKLKQNMVNAGAHRYCTESGLSH